MGFGFGTGSPLPSGFSSNITSLSLNFSESGGLSASGLGFNYSSRGGMSFDPSIGVCATARWGTTGTFDEKRVAVDPYEVPKDDTSGKPNVAYGDNEGTNKFADKVFKRPTKMKDIRADGTGGVGKTKDGGFNYGITKYVGFKSIVYLSDAAFKSKAFLLLTIQHEYAHVVMNNAGYSNNTTEQEIIAHDLSYTQAYEWKLYDYADSFGYKKSDYEKLFKPVPGYYKTHYITNFKNIILKKQPW